MKILYIFVLIFCCKECLNFSHMNIIKIGQNSRFTRQINSRIHEFPSSLDSIATCYHLAYHLRTNGHSNFQKSGVEYRRTISFPWVTFVSRVSTYQLQMRAVCRESYYERVTLINQTRLLLPPRAWYLVCHVGKIFFPIVQHISRIVTFDEIDGTNYSLWWNTCRIDKIILIYRLQCLVNIMLVYTINRWKLIL